MRPATMSARVARVLGVDDARSRPSLLPPSRRSRASMRSAIGPRGPGYRHALLPRPGGDAVAVERFRMDRVAGHQRRVSRVRPQSPGVGARPRDERSSPRAGLPRALGSPDALGAGVEPGAPVVSVSWFAARAFCASRGERLPTEAEWERAATRRVARARARSRAPRRAPRPIRVRRPKRLPHVGAGAPNVWGCAICTGSSGSGSSISTRASSATDAAEATRRYAAARRCARGTSSTTPAFMRAASARRCARPTRRAASAFAARPTTRRRNHEFYNGSLARGRPHGGLRPPGARATSRSCSARGRGRRDVTARTDRGGARRARRVDLPARPSPGRSGWEGDRPGFRARPPSSSRCSTGRAAPRAR